MIKMTSHEELIAQFSDVTSVDAGGARFFLECAGWQLDVALTSFYETYEQGATASGATTADVATNETTQETSSSEQQPKEVNQANYNATTRQKIATLKDLQKNHNSSDEEEGQAFYAGGSENSGQQVYGPGKKDLITEMFKSCKEQSLSIESKSKKEKSESSFSGTGYKLGQASNDVEVVAAPSSAQEADCTLITLKLWRNGFTINERGLRSYNDPKNTEFLNAIKRGEVPIEIQQEIHSGEVRLDMEDHRNEEYTPPKIQLNVFSGKGYTLGSPSPATVSMPVVTDIVDADANERQARTDLNFDANNPSTTIQIRFADGSHVRENFNLSHTIGDLRRFITTLRPQYASLSFRILTAYPTKELNEESVTIADANLQNSTVIQRLK